MPGKEWETKTQPKSGVSDSGGRGEDNPGKARNVEGVARWVWTSTPYNIVN